LVAFFGMIFINGAARKGINGEFEIL